jgi:Beta-propeller repeat
MKIESPSWAAFKLAAFSVIFSMVGVFLALLATASPQKSTREGASHMDVQVLDANEMSLAPAGRVQEAWVARYDGPGNDFDAAEAIAVDNSGNIYVTGRSSDPDFSTHYATVKYNSAGQEQWIVRYYGPGNYYDMPTAIAVDTLGNVYVTGYGFGSGSNYDYATIKYDSFGQEQWVARYNGPNNGDDGAEEIAVDGSGNVYVTGVSRDGSGFSDYVTIKYDSAGQQVWVARYYSRPGNYPDESYAIGIDSLGNAYVAGTSVFYSGASYDYGTIKYNSVGQQQWVGRYNGSGNRDDYAAAIAVDGSGNVYVTGSSWGSGTDYDYATIKYNSAGQQEWVGRYDGPGNGSDNPRAIAIDNSGSVYVTGQSVGSGNDTGFDYATIKYDSVGREQWVARYNGPGNLDDEAHGIAVDNAGDVYVTGESPGSGSDYDYATIKYDSSGQEQWIARYNGPANSYDVATAIAVDGSANVYVTGRSGVGSDLDYATIKYVQGAEPTPTPTVTPTSTPTASPTATPTAPRRPSPRPRPTPQARPDLLPRIADSWRTQSADSQHLNTDGPTI